MTTLLIVILYIIIALVTYGFIIYYEIGNIDEELSIVVSMAWPFMLIVFIVIGPFFLVGKLSKKLKKINNLKNIDLKKI